MQAFIDAGLKDVQAPPTERATIEMVIAEDGSVLGPVMQENLRNVNFLVAVSTILRTMPKWRPGKHNGVPVRVLVTIVVQRSGK